MIDEAGEPKRALQIARESLELKTDPVFYTLLAQILRSQKKYRESLFVLKEFKKEFPNYIEVFILQAEAYSLAGQPQKAKKTWSEVLVKDPDNLIALNNLAYMYADEGSHLKQAEKMIQKAVDMEKDNPYFLDTLGWVYFKQGRFQEALVQLERAFLLKPSESSIAEHLSQLYQKINQIKKSLAFLKKAFKLETDVKRKKELKKRFQLLQASND